MVANIHDLEWLSEHISPLWLLLVMMSAVTYTILHVQYQRIINPPGSPICWPVVGMLPTLLIRFSNAYEWMTEQLHKSGGTYWFKGPGMNTVITSKPENIEHILRTNFWNYPKGAAFQDIFNELLGHGIFNSDAEDWREQRKVASLEVFSREFRNFSRESVEQTVSSKLIPLLTRMAKSGEEVDMQEVFMRYTLENTCKVVFGEDIDYLAEGLPNLPFAEAFEEAMRVMTYRHVLPFFVWKVFRFLRIGPERRLQKSLKVLRGFVLEFVARKKSRCGGMSMDLLSTFARKLSKENEEEGFGFLRDVVMNFVIAGRDTSGAALTWLTWLIATHPEAERLVVNEKGEVDMVYLEAAIYEALRLYPSVPNDHKAVLKDDVLPDGTVVKGGARVMYCIYAVGRMESVWGTDCSEFKPERWIEVDKHGNRRVKQESAFKFPAFNGGPRLCLGKEVAFGQMKVAASRIFGRFNVRVRQSYVPTARVSLILTMKHGLPVTLSLRNG